MKLTQRLLVGSLGVVLVLVAGIVAIAGNRLRNRLADDTRLELEREARLVALQWRAGVDAESLAHAAGAALGRRVTLIRADGVVIGDSNFGAADLRMLENHSTRPEVMAARDSGIGWSMRSSVSVGNDEMYVAVKHPLGFVRVSVFTTQFEEIVGNAQHDVLVAALFALAGAIILAWGFSRTVSRPIIELRDVARAIAGGELDRRPALSAPGEVGDLAAALHRMTEQLAARMAALEREDALLSAVIEALDEGIVAADRRGEVVRINASARRLLALDGAVPFSVDLLPPDRAMREAVRAATRGNDAMPTEVAVDGRTLLVTARPLADGGAVLALMDLTARRRLETIRRDFVANASHELKTPLTIVSGFAETLRDAEMPPEDRERFVAGIVANARRMQRIVDDLLDLSRYESGAWVPHVVTNDLAAVVADAFASAHAAARDKGLALTSSIPPEANRVRADATALRQVVSNLVENAVRYTSAGGVEVSAARLPDGGVALRVADTGIGIPPEHIDRIFERFYRVDAGRSRDEGGTGLGLAIVKHLVEAHGGSVRAESAPGRGTAISVQLPEARVTAA